MLCKVSGLALCRGSVVMFVSQMLVYEATSVEKHTRSGSSKFHAHASAMQFTCSITQLHMLYIEQDCAWLQHAQQPTQRLCCHEWMNDHDTRACLALQQVQVTAQANCSMSSTQCGHCGRERTSTKQSTTLRRCSLPKLCICGVVHGLCSITAYGPGCCLVHAVTARLCHCHSDDRALPVCCTGPHCLPRPRPCPNLVDGLAQGGRMR